MLESYIINKKIQSDYQTEFYQYYMRIVLGSKDIVYGKTLMSDEDEQVCD